MKSKSYFISYLDHTNNAQMHSFFKNEFTDVGKFLLSIILKAGLFPPPEKTKQNNHCSEPGT